MVNSLAATALSAFLVVSSVAPAPAVDPINPDPNTTLPVESTEALPSAQNPWPEDASYPNLLYTKSSEIQEGTADAGKAGIFWVETVNTQKNRFVNQAHGYSISLPKNMFVTDMSYSNLRSVLEDSHRRLEIYKQTITSQASYYNYTYRFLQNKDDHTLEYRGTTTIGGHHANVTQWTRKKLSKVANDKNYYAAVDVYSGNTVYSFFFTSDTPFYLCGGYLEMLQDFQTFAPTVAAKNRVCQSLYNKKLNVETRQFFNKYFSDNSTLSWGVFEPSAPGWDMQPLQTMEKEVDFNFKYLILYSHIRKDYGSYNLENLLTTAYNAGKTVEVTLQTTTQNAGEGNMVYDILDGAFDDYLNKYSKAIAKFGHPVIMRLCNEMNGDWCDFCAFHTSRDAQMYVQMYKYIYNIFERNGANANTLWVWNPNERSFPDFPWNQELAYYPGDEYVDIVGITGYNTGTYYAAEKWRTFSSIYGPLYERATAQYNKPLMITEFSCSSVGGDKTQWINDMFADIKNYPRIKAAIWWDGCDYDSNGDISRSYFMNDKPEYIEAFKENLKEYK